MLGSAVFEDDSRKADGELTLKIEFCVCEPFRVRELANSCLETNGGR